MITRRTFLASTLGAVGSSALSARDVAHDAFYDNSVTVQQVIEIITKGITVDQRSTVDTLKAGRPDQKVKGIVTTMFATIDVIRSAVDTGANFIIAHEPTFYNHTDETGWLESHEVYRFKKELLEKNGIAVWRLHDYIHSFRPDGVLMGVLESLGWEKYYDPSEPVIVQLPATTLGDIIRHVKERLSIDTLRYIGDRDQMCRKIALLPGAWGGRRQISTLSAHRPDVMICGEISEWETSEYIRDVQATGGKQGLVVLGHAGSEEPGMRWLRNWLQPKLPNLKITHIPSGNPFSFD